RDAWWRNREWITTSGIHRVKHLLRSGCGNAAEPPPRPPAPAPNWDKPSPRPGYPWWRKPWPRKRGRRSLRSGRVASDVDDLMGIVLGQDDRRPCAQGFAK